MPCFVGMCYVVEAMLQLYDNAEELTFMGTTETSGSATETIGDKARFINKIGDKLATNKDIGDKLAIKLFVGDKLAINEEAVDKLAHIMVFLKQHPRSKSADVAEVMGMGKLFGGGHCSQNVSSV